MKDVNFPAVKEGVEDDFAARAQLSRRGLFLGVLVSAASLAVTDGEARATVVKKILAEKEAGVQHALTNGKILHVRVGSDSWEPTQKELQKVHVLFRNAAIDPMGSIATTSHYVVVDVIDLT